MSRLLIDENPLQVLPKLAAAIGLNEAIVLQQIHYWLARSTTQKDGYAWTYNTIQQWQEQFPFWSDDTVRRTLASLRKQGLLVGERLSENRFDKTLFYRIDYEQLARIEDGILPPSNTPILPPSEDGKLPPSGSANCHLEYKTETSTETTETPTENSCDTPFERFWMAYPNTARRVAKSECLKKWKAHKLDAVASKVIDHVKAMCKTAQWKDGYEPAPLTYLNQRRWEDGIPQDKGNGSGKPGTGQHTGFDGNNYGEGIDDAGRF